MPCRTNPMLARWWRGFFDGLGNLSRGRGTRRITAGQAGREAVVDVVKTRHLGGPARRRGVISLEIYPFCRAWASGTPPRKGWSPKRAHQRCGDGGRISRQAMPTSRDSGRTDSPVGFWWSCASGRQAQAVSRAARVSVAVSVRRLGPVRRPVIIDVAGLRHDGGPGGGQPAVQGLAIRGGAVRAGQRWVFGR